MKGRTVVLVLGLVSPLVLAACETSDDASAELSCEHFHNVAGDASEGILSDAELREKLKEIDETAQVSEDAAVRNSARGMLAAITQGNMSDFDSAVSQMSDACDPYRD